MSERSKSRTLLRSVLLASAFAALIAPSIGSASSGGAPKLTSIALDPTGTVSLIPGDTQALHATATFSDKSTKDYTAQVMFTSSDPSVVGLVGPALAQAIASGDAEISAVD